ncbi:MAG: hypothetical protein ABID45_03690 [Patescibacteria group bacterium]
MKKIYLTFFTLLMLTFPAIALSSPIGTVGSIKVSIDNVVEENIINYNELSTYQNERHKYEIKYPNDYKIIKVENPVSISSEKPDGTEFNIEVSYLEGKTFEEWIQDDIGFENLDILNPEVIILSGKNGLKINEPGYGEGIFHYYIATEKTGNDIIVDISTWSENFINEDFKNIISTFKFLD